MAIKEQLLCTSRQRPYHIEHTSSRPITEVDVRRYNIECMSLQYYQICQLPNIQFQ